jgi:hypothetical protein
MLGLPASLRTADAVMREYRTVTDADLERARHDGPFRQQMIVNNLDRLLVELSRLRNAGEIVDKASARQMREGAQLAAKLADILHEAAGNNPPEPNQAG